MKFNLNKMHLRILYLYGKIIYMGYVTIICMQTNLCENMQVKSSRGFQAGSVRSNFAQLCIMVLLWPTSGPSGQHSCHHDQRYRILHRTHLRYHLLRILFLDKACKFHRIDVQIWFVRACLVTFFKVWTNVRTNYIYFFDVFFFFSRGWT